MSVHQHRGLTLRVTPWRRHRKTARRILTTVARHAVEEATSNTEATWAITRERGSDLYGGLTIASTSVTAAWRRQGELPINQYGGLTDMASN